MLPVNNLILLEEREQVVWISQNLPVEGCVKLVALTAEAVLALDELSLSFTPISQIADTRLLASVERQYSSDCFNLLNDIEGWILENFPPAVKIGRGFLTGQAYYVQMSIGAIATRTFLMREAVRVFSPASVTIFKHMVDDWFGDDGYECNPWIEAFLANAEDSLQIHTISLSKTRIIPYTSWLKGVYPYLRSRAIEKAQEIIKIWKSCRLKTASQASSFRLLFVDAQLYNWKPIIDVIHNNPNFSLSFLKSALLFGWGRWWARYYLGVIYRDHLLRELPLNCAPIRFDKDEQDTLSALLDNWIVTHPERAKMEVLGMEMFPSLLTHLRSVLLMSIPLAQYSHELAVKALDLTRPHAICFNSLSQLSSKILAVEACQRDIPVLTYQHGGAYGIQVVPTHDFAEYAFSDYFLTYGDGIHPPQKPVVPTKAQFVPVGSVKLEMSIKKNRKLGHSKHRSINVLWIGEVSFRNTIGGAWVVEDTSRYLLEKKSLEILNANGINVVYRPFPGNHDSLVTPKWLEQVGLVRASLDKQKSLEKSILEADVVICDSSSSTTWNEVLALGKPLIVYCDPQQTILMDHFAKDLEKACYWCKSVPELLDVIQRLAKEPKELVNELCQKPTDEYLRRYVLHEGNSVERVISFLSEVCSEGLKRE